MNQRIAKKITDRAVRLGATDPDNARPYRRRAMDEAFRLIPCATRRLAQAVEAYDAEMERKAAVVRAKRGWSQRGARPDASWLPDPYGA